MWDLSGLSLISLKKVLNQSHHFNWVQNPVLQNQQEELLYSSNYWRENKLEPVQQTGFGLVSVTWELAPPADEVSDLQCTDILEMTFYSPSTFLTQLHDIILPQAILASTRH